MLILNNSRTGDTGITVLDTDWSGDWVTRIGAGNTPTFHTGSTATQVSVGGDTWLRVTYMNGTPGANNGMTFSRPLTKHTAYGLEFSFRLKPGFVYNHSGKFWGLRGGISNAGTKPDGTDRFTSRCTWDSGGRIDAYITYPDQAGAYGDTFDLGLIPADVIHYVKQELHINTPGQHDGSAKFWFNGVLKLDKQNMRFRDIDSLQIDKLMLDTFFGGGEPTQGPKRDEYIDFGPIKLTRLPG